MISGIILAAGASSRMGVPKALLDYRGETFLNRLIRVMGTVCDPMIVALGYHADEIRRSISGSVRMAVNPDPSRGQLSSLQTALLEVPDDAEAFLFMPVDCPAVDAATVSQVVEALNAPGKSLLVIPRHDGERGHPVCARRELIQELLAMPPTGRAKEVIYRHKDRTHYLDTEDAGVLTDIDDPEAYRILQETTW